jgi:hypothetical protein
MLGTIEPKALPWAIPFRRVAAVRPAPIRHSPFAIRHSPFAIRHSPFANHQSAILFALRWSEAQPRQKED